jgi:hypothetical protein
MVEEYGKHTPANGVIQTEKIIDQNSDHYEVLHVGWQGTRRVHGSAIHLDIIDGKIWIQHNGTNRSIADDLLEAGVPREDIVLALHPPEVRQYTEFAAA